MQRPSSSVLAFVRISLGLALAPVALVMLLLFIYVHLGDDGSGATASCLKDSSAVTAVLGSALFAAVLGATAALSVSLMINAFSWQLLGLFALTCGAATVLGLGLTAAVGYDRVLDGLRCPTRIYV